VANKNFPLLIVKPCIAHQGTLCPDLCKFASEGSFLGPDHLRPEFVAIFGEAPKGSTSMKNFTNIFISTKL